MATNDGIITADRIGAGDTTLYGADVAPTDPVQDMYAFDPIVGSFPDAQSAADPGSFTGGTGGGGLGGNAEGMSPGGVGPDGALYERRGF
jgi:hypothetical protein